MNLSVIIPCLNAGKYIGNQLEALANQVWSEPWEVIIADNGSTDETLEIVEQYRKRLPNLRVVDASDRRGAAHARNIGAQAALGDALAFCDSDDEVAPGWVAAMGKALSQYDFVASRFEAEKLNAAWVCKGRWNPQQDGLQHYRYPPYLPHAGGSGLGVKRSRHEAIGGFDESLVGLEDTDYCWRLQLAGTELHFAPDAVVHTRSKNTLRGNFCQFRLWGECSVLLYKRYQPLGMPKLSWKSGVHRWEGVLRGLLRVRSRENLAAWVRRFAWNVGRLQGSIKYRVIAL